MPFKPWVRTITPLAWMLGASAVANVVTMLVVLYIAFGTPRVTVDGGFIRARISNDTFDVNVRNSIDIRDRTPVRVQVVP